MHIKVLTPDTGGVGYYVAELDEPYPLPCIWETWYPDVDEWCENTYGEEDMWGSPPLSGWKRMRNKYFFVEGDKLSWFLIKWS